MTTEAQTPAAAAPQAAAPAPAQPKAPWYKAKWFQASWKTGAIILGVGAGAALGYKGGEIRTEKRLAKS